MNYHFPKEKFKIKQEHKRVLKKAKELEKVREVVEAYI
jgi:hypothetical protein